MSEYCISVPIVYDWVTIEEKVKKYKYIPTKSNVKKMKDCICINFNVNCQNDIPTTIWQAVGNEMDAATFSIHHEGTCACEWRIMANQEEIASVSPTNTISITVGNLERLSVLCANNCSEEATWEGTLYIVVHYLIPAGEQSERKPKKVTCFLSDKHGNPADLYNGNTLICRESKPGRRKSKSFLTPDGRNMLLQKVSILIEGYISVRVTDICDGSFTIITFPISMVKTFFLCAPNGTEIVCDIDDFYCDTCLVEDKSYKDCIKVLLDVSFCLHVQSRYKTVINLKGDLCEPRAALADKLYNCY